MTNRTKPTCPDCKSIMIPYLYGMPAGPPPEDGGADDFFIAGCLPDFPSPKWGCRTCWRKSIYGDDDADSEN